MKKDYCWRQLGSKRLTLVIILNLLNPIIALLAGFWIVRFQIDHHIVADASYLFQFRVCLLCLLLSLIVTGVLDYFTILRPISEMEELLDEYVEIAQSAGDQIVLDGIDSITLRSAFAQIIRRQRRIVQKNRVMEEKQLSTELHALQSRINPHFLYNTLDSIRGLAYYHGIDEIAELTQALSQLFRNMISKEGQLLTLRQEMDNINNYIKIQMFRFNHNFTYECNIVPELLDRYKILNMTLQPIIENAIMHGLERRVGMGVVRIEAYTTERRLVIRVSDNGVGIPEEKLAELNESFNSGANVRVIGDAQKHSGIGLTTINRRLKLQFGDKYGLSLSSTPYVDTTTELVLPLIANVR